MCFTVQQPASNTTTHLSYGQYCVQLYIDENNKDTTTLELTTSEAQTSTQADSSTVLQTSTVEESSTEADSSTVSTLR